MSTKDCTFTKHSHIISGLIMHLDGKKTWYISNKRESFLSIKYKSFLNPNPLYVTDKRPSEEIPLISTQEICFIFPHTGFIIPLVMIQISVIVIFLQNQLNII